MKTEAITTTTHSAKIVAYICAEGHERITYYNGDCPLCREQGVNAILMDQLNIAQYEIQTLKES